MILKKYLRFFLIFPFHFLVTKSCADKIFYGIYICLSVTTKSANTTVNILLVEDYASLAIMLKELASIYAPSCKIKWVDNGAQAIEMIAKGGKYDAFIIDYLMPIMDGVQTTKAIRKLGYQGRIIGWCPFLEQKEEKECLDAGMNFYVEKSANLDPLIEMLKSLHKR